MTIYVAMDDQVCTTDNFMINHEEPPVGYIRMYKAEQDAKLCPVSTSVYTYNIN